MQAPAPSAQALGALEKPKKGLLDASTCDVLGTPVDVSLKVRVSIHHYFDNHYMLRVELASGRAVRAVGKKQECLEMAKKVRAARICYESLKDEYIKAGGEWPPHKAGEGSCVVDFTI